MIVKRIDEESISPSDGWNAYQLFLPYIRDQSLDGERLIPEYEGESPADYPGNNDEYSVSGYHYDKRG